MTELEQIKEHLRKDPCKSESHFPGCPCSILRVIEALEANQIPGRCGECYNYGVGHARRCGNGHGWMDPDDHCSDWTPREAGRE